VWIGPVALVGALLQTLQSFALSLLHFRQRQFLEATALNRDESFASITRESCEGYRTGRNVKYPEHARRRAVRCTKVAPTLPDHSSRHAFAKIRQACLSAVEGGNVMRRASSSILQATKTSGWRITKRPARAGVWPPPARHIWPHVGFEHGENRSRSRLGQFARAHAGHAPPAPCAAVSVSTAVAKSVNDRF